MSVGAILLWTSAAARGQGEGENVYKRLLRSTVWIVVPESRVIDQINQTARVRLSTGSGSLIDAGRKIVLTNYHVVGNHNEVFVMFPFYRNGDLVVERDAYRDLFREGKAIRAKVKLKDKARDLALLELEQVPPGAVALRLARTSAGPGQRVHSVGNPGASGALWVYTSGTVRTNAYHKTFLSGPEDGPKIEINAHVIETQSPTNPGDSGGPLVNDKGELVAVTQGGIRDAQNVSIFIDVREVTALLAGAKIRPQIATGKEDEEKPKGSTAAKSKTAKRESAEDAALKAEKLAKNKLNFAIDFFESKKINDARDYCEQIIEKYPNTKAAVEAKELLEKIKKKK